MTLAQAKEYVDGMMARCEVLGIKPYTVEMVAADPEFKGLTEVYYMQLEKADAEIDERFGIPEGNYIVKLGS